MPWYMVLAMLIFSAVIYFANWVQGLYCLRALGLAWLATVGFLALTQPGLLRRRRLAPKEGPTSPEWDSRILGYLRVSLLLVLAVAGWETGRGDTPFDAELFGYGAGLLVFGTLVMWASFRSNPFFETGVRHQAEQGQRVVQTGLYSRVRHPGYLAMIFMLASLPVMLHSGAAVLPWALCVGVLVARLQREEAYLVTHLEGYADYRQRVPFRLIPYLW